MAEPLSRRVVCCASGYDAQEAGDFAYLPHARAFAFTDQSVVRSMSPRARYYAFSERSEYHHEDHTGEPVRYTCCPWCGADLPGTDDLFPRIAPPSESEGQQ